MKYRVEVPKRMSLAAHFADRHSAEAYAAALFYSLRLSTRIINTTPTTPPAAPF